MKERLGLEPIIQCAFDQAHGLLAPDPGSTPDLAMYAAYWLRSRCHASGPSFLSSFVLSESGRDFLQEVDLPGLSTQGFLLRAGLLYLDAGAPTQRLKAAVERVARRRPHTEELSGPADDPLCLLGLWMLAAVVAPQTASLFLSWIELDALSPTLRLAFLLAGAVPTAQPLILDASSPQSLAAHLLATFADLRPGVPSGVERSLVVSQLVTADVGGRLSRGEFDALAVLLAFELVLQNAKGMQTPETQEIFALDPQRKGRDRSLPSPRSKPRPPNVTTPEISQRLLELLTRIFNSDTLRAWLPQIPEGARVVAHMPGITTSPALTFAGAIDILERWGLVGAPAFWDALSREAPAALKVEVAALRASFHVPPGGGPTALSSSERPAARAVKVLLVSANPSTSVRLRVDMEFNRVIAKIRSTPLRDHFELIQLNCASYEDLVTALLWHAPHVLHISCHGDSDGNLQFEAGESDGGRLSKASLLNLLLALRDNLRLVIVNACHSWAVARSIPPTVDLAIGMSDAIQDREAIDFAVVFYQALGHGRSVESAFAVATARLDGNVPQLFPAAEADSEDRRRLVLVQE